MYSGLDDLAFAEKHRNHWQLNTNPTRRSGPNNHKQHGKTAWNRVVEWWVSLNKVGEELMEEVWRGND